MISFHCRYQRPDQRGLRPHLFCVELRDKLMPEPTPRSEGIATGTHEKKSSNTVRLLDATLVWLWPVNHHGEVPPSLGMGRSNEEQSHMYQDQLQSSYDPLLDDDETFHFLLCQELGKENGSQSQVGCLGAVGGWCYLLPGGFAAGCNL